MSFLFSLRQEIKLKINVYLSIHQVPCQQVLLVIIYVFPPCCVTWVFKKSDPCLSYTSSVSTYKYFPFPSRFAFISFPFKLSRDWKLLSFFFWMKYIYSLIGGKRIYYYISILRLSFFFFFYCYFCNINYQCLFSLMLFGHTFYLAQCNL